ncbi:MAG: DoxX family protein [Bacteriovoracia bacterium]
MENLLLSASPEWIEMGILITRLFIGVCFVVHGLGKLGVVGPGNMHGFTEWLRSLGVPMPAVQARMAMLTELLGGACIALGLGTRVALALVFCTMIVAMLIGHRGGGYLITNNPPGNEYTINLAVILAFLFVCGPGPYSLDAWLLN